MKSFLLALAVVAMGSGIARGDDDADVKKKKDLINQ